MVVAVSSEWLFHSKCSSVGHRISKIKYKEKQKQTFCIYRVFIIFVRNIIIEYCETGAV